MTVTGSPRQPIPLSAGARRSNLTPQGLLKILKRTNRAIRNDGRWYVDQGVVEQIVAARRILGVERKIA
jgi:hypothetical protein